MTNTIQDLMTILFTGRRCMIKVPLDEREAAIATLVQFLLLGDPSGNSVSAMINLRSLDDNIKDLVTAIIIEAKL